MRAGLLQALTALALFAAGKVFVRDAWTDLASDAVGRLARAQHPAGNFLTPAGSDNPNTAASSVTAAPAAAL